ncbi:uncharacterized protein LOC121256466 [Juglans microcarpa x Juglans regia]|uniref:uncharacterized protein LOC121256466 n=1 Tax=Juglans microcarpa x Juglans regia TaxID=2249226 RepID=UPI001B7E34CC|nr:uncharacterized protein LOC121256466 [Juglans microcarpa x Juglans regia]
MNGRRSEDNSFCHFHPKQMVVGVCPLCLNERLLILASNQDHFSSSRSSVRRGQTSSKHKKPPITLPKIFALGGSFLSRLEFRHWKYSGNSDHDIASISPEGAFEDSFISIKFGDNGVASWEKNTVSKVSLENCNMSWNNSLTQELTKEAKETKENKTVIEHGKPRASLRWRKRIGHLFQVMRLKKSNKGNVCHVSSKVEGVKVRKGWIRTLTKRKTTME